MPFITSQLNIGQGDMRDTMAMVAKSHARGDFDEREMSSLIERIEEKNFNPQQDGVPMT